MEVMNWPRNNPDMNFIEHLWFLLKEAVSKINLDTEKVCGNDESLLKALSEALFRAWEDVDEYYLHDLVWSMQNRVKVHTAA